MLIRFTVQNYLSIDEPVDFTMQPTKESRHSERVARMDESSLRLLQMAVFFGGNGSGKSNFIRAIDFARRLVVAGTPPEGSIGRIPFKLRESAAQEPSRFEFEVLVGERGNEMHFRYSFLITSKSVLEESLTEIRPASEKVLFHRKTVHEDQDPVFSLDFAEGKGTNEDERQFVRFVARGTRRNQLFLREAMERNIPALAPVYHWFRDQLVILEPDADYQPLEIVYDKRPDLQAYVARMLNSADTGVTRLASEAVPIESLGLPSGLREQIAANLKEGGSGILVKGPFRRSLFLRQGELIANRLVTYRNSADGSKEVKFDTDEESDGTLRLLDLSPIFFDLVAGNSQKTYIIDELDRSMHAILLIALLKGFCKSRSPEKRAQLIFSSLKLQLLNQSLLRRDEIWFVERSPGGSSRLFRLSSRKEVRHDTDILKAYMQGEYLGIPKIGEIELGDS